MHFSSVLLCLSLTCFELCVNSCAHSLCTTCELGSHTGQGLGRQRCSWRSNTKILQRVLITPWMYMDWFLLPYLSILVSSMSQNQLFLWFSNCFLYLSKVEVTQKRAYLSMKIFLQSVLHTESIKGTWKLNSKIFLEVAWTEPCGSTNSATCYPSLPRNIICS